MLKVQLLTFLHSFEKICSTVNLVRPQVCYTVPYFRVVVNKTASTFSYHFVFLLFVFAGFWCKTFLKLINIFVFFVFILVDACGFPVFWFHQDRNHKKSFYLSRK